MEEMSPAARERWLALIDETESSGLQGVRAEALVRLAFLEYARKTTRTRPRYVARLDAPELAAALPGWKDLLPELARLAPSSAHGGGRIPPTEPLSPSPRPRAPGTHPALGRRRSSRSRRSSARRPRSDGAFRGRLEARAGARARRPRRPRRRAPTRPRPGPRANPSWR